MIEKHREILEHMLGANYEKPHSRNYYCAEVNSEDFAILKEMCGLGLTFPGAVINGGRDMYFHAYADTMHQLGLTESEIEKRAWK